MSELSDSITAAAAAIRRRVDRPWKTLIILGSGLGPLADEIQNAVRVPYSEIPGFAQSTVASHAGAFVIGDLMGVPVGVMQGRTHFYEGYPLKQTTLPVRVAKALGADTMIVTNAAGGINRGFQVADLMLITDHINMLGLGGNNPLIGPNDDALGPRFPAMTETYSLALQAVARRVAARSGVALKEGVYLGLAGPYFETPAEIRFMRTIGADAVGMSTVSEVLVAIHGGMRVLGFSGITNVARLTADEGEPPSHEEVMAASVIIAPKLIAVVKGVLKEIAEAS